MKPPLAFAFALLLASGLVADAADSGGASEPDDKPRRNWLSFLLPKSFDPNPRVDFNVITEKTAEGRKLPAPSPGQPAYYAVHPVGYQKRGQGAPAREKSPPPEVLREAMIRALAGNGYREASETTPSPSLLIVYYWGSYTSAGWDAQATGEELNREAANPEDPPRPVMHNETAEDLLPLVLTDMVKRQELLERAALVGGLRFAAELQKVLNEEADYEVVRESEVRLAEFMSRTGGGGTTGGTTLGGAVAGDVTRAFRSFNPFYRFKNRNARTSYLVEQSFGSFYFVVASAYEYESVANEKRTVLWRTKMTVDSSGVAMIETLPRLIATAAPYFGVDMEGTTTVTKRIDREGSVEIGTPEVLGYEDANAGTEDESGAFKPEH